MTDTLTRPSTSPSGLADDVRTALEACGVDLSVVSGDARSTTAVASPITGEPLLGARLDTRADIDAAVGRAAEAFPAWRDTPAPVRGQLVKRWGELLTEHMPGLDGRTQLEFDTGHLGHPDPREAELQVRVEPRQVDVEIVRPQIRHHLGQVGHGEVGQQEAFVQGRTPAHQRMGVRILGEASDQGPDQ